MHEWIAKDRAEKVSPQRALVRYRDVRIDRRAVVPIVQDASDELAAALEPDALRALAILPAVVRLDPAADALVLAEDEPPTKGLLARI